MKYLNEKHLREIGINWHKTVGAIEAAARTIGANDYAQPIKPYLRYRDLKNRIIAMPAFVGGDINSAGIKWIASFPDNIHKNLPRASSVLILNDVDTGIPEAVINGGLLSAIRTASVSGLLVREYQKSRQLKQAVVGMTGFGPIGQCHLAMINALLTDQISKIKIFDLRPIDLTLIDPALRKKVQVVSSWQEAYADADIFMTCTVSKERYVDLAPKPGSLQLNVSLRDYKPEVLQQIDVHIVDSWDEICRENTDIEMAHKTFGLKEQDTVSIGEFVNAEAFFDSKKGKTVMFNPMGMAIFDMAIARHFVNAADQKNIGVELES